jgi:hemolysin activation/secretion protein
MPMPMKTVLLTVTAALTCASWAAGVEIPDSGLLLRESTPPPTLAPRQEPPRIERPAERKKQAPPGIRVRVGGFRFVGNRALSRDQLSALLAHYVGKDMTLIELNEAAAAITRAYRDKGYFLAHAFIPPQTVKAGTPILIEVVEGTLERVRVETIPGETRVPKGLLQGFADRVPVNEPVQEGSLISMVMMVNELPNISSRILLEPGVRPGSSAARLEVTEGKSYGLSLDADNSGNYSTGEYRVGAGLELYSPFRLGDQFSLRAQTSTSGDTQAVHAGHSVPVNSYGTRVGFDYTYVVYQLGRSFEALRANGDAHSFGLGIKQPLLRSRNLTLNATLAGEGKLLDDRLDSVGVRNRRHTAGWQAGLDGVETDNLLRGGYTSFSLGYLGGQLGIDDAASLANDQASGGLGTDGGYTKISMLLARTQALYGGFSLYAGGYGQWADKNLDSSEQISLGGPNAVRAWQPDDASGDSGVVTSAELRYAVDQLGILPGSLQLCGFFDYGYAVLHNDPAPGGNEETRNLTGAGFGVSWFAASSFSVRTTVAWKISGETRPRDTPMVYFQALTRF